MRSKPRVDGFTLTETMVSTALFIFVTAAIYTFYIGLQRGSVFSVNWSESRVSQQRVLDSIGVDLRNAIGVEVGSGTMLLRLTIPARYAAYETSGFAAGDPALSSTNGLLVGLNSNASGTNTVVYSQVNNIVSRIMTTSGGVNASRVVGDFSLWNGVTGAMSQAGAITVKIQDASGNLLSGTVTADTVVPLVIATVASESPKLPAVSSTLSDIILLRAKCFKP
jgi:type II secretory pathway component PulJ